MAREVGRLAKPGMKLRESRKVVKAADLLQTFDDARQKIKAPQARPPVPAPPQPPKNHSDQAPRKKAGAHPPSNVTSGDDGGKGKPPPRR